MGSVNQCMGNTLCRRFCDVPSIDPFESGIGSVNSASILLWFMNVKHHEWNRKILSKKLKLRLTSASMLLWLEEI